MDILEIENKDLFLSNYSNTILEKNIDKLVLLDILTTQKLSIEFAVKYILDPNEKYAKTEDDKDICINDVLHFQKHIKETELYKFLGVVKT